MPILSGGPLYRDKTNTIEDYPSSLGETFAAGFDRAVDTGLSELAGGALRIARGDIGGIQEIGRPFGVDAAAEVDPSSRVYADDARKRAGASGVKLVISDDAYFSPGELDTVIALKKRERAQLQTLGRRPQTWGGFAAEMGGGLAGSMTDPVQVAASFIPVVGQARYARFLAGASGMGERAAIRAGVGAIEGLAGAALLEPLIYSRAQSIGLEYTSTDSFMNLAFGTVMGGGLHVAGGFIGDMATPARRAAVHAPDVKSREALATAVTALDSGRAVDVSDVFDDTAFLARELNRAPDIDDAALSRALADIEAVAAGNTERAPDLVGEIRAMGGIRIVDNDGRVTSEGGDVRSIFDKRYPPGLVNNKTGIPLDYVRERLQESGWLRAAGDGPNDTTTADVLDLLAQWRGGKKPLPIGEARGEDLSGVASEMKAAGVTKADSADVASFKLAKYRADLSRADAPELVREPAVMPDTYDPATGYEPPEMEHLRIEADEAAMAAVDDIDGEIEALGEMMAMAEKRGPMTDYDRSALDLADAFETNARRTADSYRAAAACISGVA